MCMLETDFWTICGYPGANALYLDVEHIKICV